MIKIVYANGDSFGFGQELDGPRTPAEFYTFSDYQKKHCYSGVLAARWGTEYQNESMPGGSNQRIYRTTLHSICKLLNVYKPEEIFVFASLTHNHRREFYRVDRDLYHPHMFTYKPAEGGYITDFWKIMVERFHHPKGDLELDQQMILGLQNFLRVNKVPYLLTWSMHHGAIYEEEKKYVPEYLLKERRSTRFLESPSFSDYAFNQLKLEKAPGGHPLTDGHLAWANLLAKYIEKNNLLSNNDL